MRSFLDKHDILSSTQYGFLEGKGTQTLLEEFSDLLNSSFEHNHVSCGLFLDVSKAFDSVWHDLLLEKLSLLGFRGVFLLLLKHFLQGRYKSVKIGECHSVPSLLRAGVPQGSILSPLLFNIYVNDVVSSVPVPLFQYADDTVLIASAKDYKDAVVLLQKAAINIMDWFRHNSIKVNAAKTQLICFHNPLKKVKLEYSLFLHTFDCSRCTCKPIKCWPTVKYLGLHIDSDLSWNSHLSHVCKQLRAVSALLYNIKYYMPISVRKVVTHALAYSNLRYGITVYGQCSLRWKNRIDGILRSILKNVAYDISCYENKAGVFYVLSLPNFDHLLMETVVRKHFWTSAFKQQYIPVRCLRPKDLYCIPRCSTRYGRRMRHYYVPFYFNKLPPSIFSVKTKY